jgi:LacI family transcriptional regulator
MKTTIYDVAEKAKVSIATVSRVLNKNNRVKDSTKQKVLEAIRELDFHPNDTASNLASNKTKIIGALLSILDDLTFPDSFNFSMILGIQNVLRKHDYDLLLISTDDEQNIIDDEPRYAKVVQGKKIDGLISASNKIDVEYIEKFASNDFPLVIFGDNRYNTNVCQCRLDMKQYYDKAIGYLVDRYHRDICLVYYSNNQDHEKELTQCIRDIFIQYHIPFKKNKNLINGSKHRNTINVVLKDTINKNNFTAFFTDSIYYARRLVEVSTELGLKVPDDLSIMSFEYIVDEGMRISPPVTSILISGESFGEICAYSVFDLINHIDNKRQFNVKLTERGSVKGKSL